MGQGRRHHSARHRKFPRDRSVYDGRTLTLKQRERQLERYGLTTRDAERRHWDWTAGSRPT